MHQLVDPLLMAKAMSFWMIATVLAITFFCYRKIEVIERYLNACKCICDARSIWGDGIIGRQIRMNMVTVVLTFPHLMYRRGDISKDANLRVPPHLRAWILWLYINLNTILACMIVLYAFITAQ